MKRWLEGLRAARKVEWFLLAALICVMLLLALDGVGVTPSPQMSEAERRLQGALEKIAGVGEVCVLLSEDQEGVCTGAVVLCTRADDVRARLEILRAVQMLTGLEGARIEILKSD